MEKVFLERMSDERVLARVAGLVARSNEVTAELLVYLAEVDRRGLYLREATGSMFAFCVERLHLSEGAAAKRIWAARTARRFPVVFQMIARGEIHLTAVTMLAPHMVEENHVELLARARHRSKREIERLVAEIAPKPDVASRVVALPHRAVEEPRISPPVTAAMGRVTADEGASCVAPVTGAMGTVTADEGASCVAPVTAAMGRVTADEGASCVAPVMVAMVTVTADEGASCVAPGTGSAEQGAIGERAPARGAAPSAGPRAVVAPLSPRRYLIRVTVGEEAHAALGQLQDLLSHQVPDRDPAIIIARALELLLQRTLARKAAVCERPREGKEPAVRNRHIPASVRRQVWERDGARCAFVSEDGVRCSSTRFLEFHHRRNWGRGAEHEPGQMEVRCRAHNQHQAELDYGAELMAARRSRAREPRCEYGGRSRRGMFGDRDRDRDRDRR